MNFTQLDQFLDSLWDLGIPGGECLIYQKRKPIYRHDYGYADKESQTKITSETLFNIYSQTKISTCVAALQLYERGKFLLTDPLSEYMPEFRDMTVSAEVSPGKRETVSAKNKIYIHNLFSMSSGYTYNCETEEIKAEKERSGGHSTTLEMVRAMAKTPLAFEPGTQWCYGLSHDILAGLIEVVSGKRFSVYLKENLFDPLGMKNTGMLADEAVKARMASQYTYNREKKSADKIGKENTFCLGSRYESGGAGLYSCVDDYILLADALANGGTGLSGNRILSRRTIDLMRTNRLSDEMLKTFDWDALAGYGYGLGVRTMIDPAGGGALSPAGEFGWSGAAGAYFLADPENELAVFYVQHMLDNLEPYVHPRLRNLIYAGLD